MFTPRELRVARERSWRRARRCCSVGARGATHTAALTREWSRSRATRAPDRRHDGAGAQPAGAVRERDRGAREGRVAVAADPTAAVLEHNLAGKLPPGGQAEQLCATGDVSARHAAVLPARCIVQAEARRPSTCSTLHSHAGRDGREREDDHGACKPCANRHGR